MIFLNQMSVYHLFKFFNIYNFLCFMKSVSSCISKITYFLLFLVYKMWNINNITANDKTNKWEFFVGIFYFIIKICSYNNILSHLIEFFHCGYVGNLMYNEVHSF